MKKGRISNRTADLIESCKEDELETLKVDSVAEKLGVNASYLSRKFKADKKMSLNDFITGVKMFRCARLLRNSTEVSTYSLARKMGFARADYFVTLFKYSYGIHPKNFAKLKETPELYDPIDSLELREVIPDNIELIAQSLQD